MLTRAAAIAVAALGLGMAAPAAAHAGVCSVGEFCLWLAVDQTDGLYHHSGSDSNLWNDRFENAGTSTIVANSTMSFWNRGTTAGGPAQVRLFTGINGSGAHTCAPQGSRGNFRYDRLNDVLWKNEVESYEWRHSC